VSQNQYDWYIRFVIGVKIEFSFFLPVKIENWQTGYTRRKSISSSSQRLKLFCTSLACQAPCCTEKEDVISVHGIN
jgi:hypothetical protein